MSHRSLKNPPLFIMLFLGTSVALFLTFSPGCILAESLFGQLFPTDPNTATDPNAAADPNAVAEPNEPNTPTEPEVGDTGITGKYIGSTVCSQCHFKSGAHWVKTLHAQALETLEAIDQDKNDHCIGCHTVGYGDEGGFVDRATTNDLAGVGCESCHGPARQHVENSTDTSLYPPVDLGSELCGVCHTGSHHPHIDEWLEAGHSGIDEHVAEGFVEGSRISACGICHSGDVFYQGVIKEQDTPEDMLLGVAPNDLTPISCVICHDPHAKTGNAPDVEDDRDFQLRYPEVTNPAPTNTEEATTDPSRLNLCGQCHHSRGRDWADTSRGPHHSVQANVYHGEMPTPDGVPLVLSRASVHLRATEQCATCHMFRKDYETEVAPTISGHTFQAEYDGCAVSGCHGSPEEAETRGDTFQAIIQARLDAILDRLNTYVVDADPDTVDWEYTSGDGPDDQNLISDEIKKVRFIMYYIEGDGSLGIHNPGYVEAMLTEAEALLTSEGL